MYRTVHVRVAPARLWWLVSLSLKRADDKIPRINAVRQQAFAQRGRRLGVDIVLVLSVSALGFQCLDDRRCTLPALARVASNTLVDFEGP